MRVVLKVHHCPLQVITMSSSISSIIRNLIVKGIPIELLIREQKKYNRVKDILMHQTVNAATQSPPRSSAP